MSPDLLLGRAAELAAIERTIRLARAGSGRHLVIAGPAGSGRTALLAYARTHAAAHGLAIRAAAGAQGERRFAFALVQQLLGPLDVPADRYDALRALTARLAADAPALVTIDDLQWCDAASLGWLLFRARRLRRIALVVAVEPGALVARLEQNGAHVVPLEPLDDRAVAALMRIELGDAVAPE